MWFLFLLLSLYLSRDKLFFKLPIKSPLNAKVISPANTQFERDGRVLPKELLQLTFSTAQDGCAHPSDACGTEHSKSDCPDRQKQHVYSRSKTFKYLTLLTRGNGVLQFFGLNSTQITQKPPLVLIQFPHIMQFCSSAFEWYQFCAAQGGRTKMCIEVCTHSHEARLNHPTTADLPGRAVRGCAMICDI